MKIRRPIRAVVYVAVIAAAVGYVVWSAARQPAWGNWTIVGRLTAELRDRQPPRKPTYHGSQLFLAPIEGGWQIIGPRLVAANLSHVPEGTVNVHFYNQPARAGFWHLVTEKRHDSVLFKPLMTDQPAPDHQTRLEILAAADLAYPGLAPPTKREFYVSGGGSTTRILWLGVLGDLSILVAFAAIIFSLVKLRREVRWRKPGCCTECEYDLTGLTADKCPECGAAVDVATPS